MIIAAALERGDPIPPTIMNAPDLDLHLVFVWEAFWELSTCRPVGMTTGSIPWTAINEYAVRYEVNSPDEFDRFVKLLYAMDESFFNLMEQQRNAQKSKN